MGWSYRCDSCGCYLDPDEGRICEECRDRMRKVVNSRERMERLAAAEWEQMRMEELAC